MQLAVAYSQRGDDAKALSKLKVFAVKETLIYSFVRVIIGPIVGLVFVKFLYRSLTYLP